MTWLAWLFRMTTSPAACDVRACVRAGREGRAPPAVACARRFQRRQSGARRGCARVREVHPSPRPARTDNTLSRREAENGSGSVFTPPRKSNHAVPAPAAPAARGYRGCASNVQSRKHFPMQQPFRQAAARLVLAEWGAVPGRAHVLTAGPSAARGHATNGRSSGGDSHDAGCSGGGCGWRQLAARQHRDPLTAHGQRGQKNET